MTQASMLKGLGAYTHDPERCWWQMEPRIPAAINPFFWSPILFVGAGVLVIVGALKGWLSGPETVLGLGLLGVPYLTRAYEMSMASHGRFAAVVFPAYIVLGCLLEAAPEWVTWITLGACATMLVAWTSLYVGGYLLF